MSSRALSIVEEFASSDHRYERINSARALAAMQSPESIVRLVHIALNDEDLDVQIRAEAELLALEGKALNYAIQELTQTLLDQNNLNREKKKRQVVAYGILGQLRAKGHEIKCPPIAFLKRLRLAATLPTYLYPVRKWHFRLRSLKWGLLGGGIGWAVFAFFSLLGQRGELNSKSLNLFMLGWLAVGAAVPTALFLTQRTAPIQVQLDRFSGSLVEILVPLLTAITSGLFILAIVICSFLYEGKSLNNSAARIFYRITILVSVLAGAIRAGTIWGNGLFRRRRLNDCAQMAMGVSFCLIGIAVSLFFAWKNQALSDAISGPGERTYAQFLLWLASPFNSQWIIWLMALPVGSGLAFTYLNIDGEFDALHPIAGRFAKPFFYITICSLSLVIGVALHLSYQERQTLLQDSEDIYSLAFSRDNKLLAGVHLKDMILIWDLATREVRYKVYWAVNEVEEKETPAIQIAFSPDGSRLAMWDQSGNEGIWDIGTQKYMGVGEKRLRDGQTRKPFKGEVMLADIEDYPVAAITALAFSENSQAVVLGDESGKLTTVDANTWKVIRTASTTFLDDKKVNNSRDSETNSNDAYPASNDISPTIREVIFQATGERLFTINDSGVQSWEYPSLRFLQQSIRFTEPTVNPDFAVNRNWVALIQEKHNASKPKAVKILDIENGIYSIPPLTITDLPRMVDITADGKILALGDESVFLIETATWKPILTLHGQGLSLDCLAFSRDSKWLASGGDNGIRLWDLSKLIK